MGTKTIRVDEEVYRRLERQKRDDESFSDVIDRLTDRDAEFEAGFGVFEDVEFQGHIEEMNERAEYELEETAGELADDRQQASDGA